MIVVAFISLLLSIVVCNRQPSFIYPATKIINGHEANEKQIPYQVSLQKIGVGRWKHICGGTILSEFWVLTAAHCIFEKWIRYRVIVGTIRYLDQSDCNRQARDVFTIHIHPQYPDGDDVKAKPFDIGLMKLVKPFTLNAYVQPIALPADHTDCIRDEDAIMSGWGMRSWWLRIASFKLRYTQVAVIPFQQCRDLIIEKVGGPVIFDNTMICTRHPTETFCNGDSGGPLVQADTLGKLKVHGVASFGDSPCGFANTPDVYTSVCVFIDWINQIVGSENST